MDLKATKVTFQFCLFVFEKLNPDPAHTGKIYEQSNINQFTLKGLLLLPLIM